MQDINTRLYLDVINNLYSKKVLKAFYGSLIHSNHFSNSNAKDCALRTHILLTKAYRYSLKNFSPTKS